MKLDQEVGLRLVTRLDNILYITIIYIYRIFLVGIAMLGISNDLKEKIMHEVIIIRLERILTI